MEPGDSTLGDLLSNIERRLSSFSESARLDAQVLLAHILGQSRTWVLAHPEARLTNEQQTILEASIAQLEGGKPLPYVLGHWEFYGLDFLVTPDVLIPRPETELLVERALDWLRAHPERRLAADIGSGSGCIAIALATHIADLQVLATDLNLPALKVASANAVKHGVADRIRFLQADLLHPIGGETRIVPKSLDLLCANLPYIPSGTLRILSVHEREPKLALDGGADGLDMIRRLFEQVQERMANDGRAPGAMLLEIEASQGKSATSLAQHIFPTSQVRVHPDYAGHDRLLEICF
jgi:release factor glutamine methyltransferase